MPDYKFNRTTLVYLLPIALLIISLFIGRYQTPLSAVVDESMKVFSSLFFWYSYFSLHSTHGTIQCKATEDTCSFTGRRSSFHSWSFFPGNLS